jgi:protein TonB
MDVNTPPAHGNAPARISVRGELMIPETKNTPVYPEQAKKDRVQGKVVLAAIIAKDGTVANLRVVSGPSPLQRSALDAVRQWRYKPFLVNGNPTEVDTTIRVLYTLAK